MVNMRSRKKESDEITLLLDDYNDIFSDFDPRPYSERALSDDFLLEAKKASKDKEEGLDLNFLIDKELRSAKKEELIKERMHEHFRHHHTLLHDETRAMKKGGFTFIISGILIMMAATYTLFRLHETLFTSFIVILLEPAGWFLFWEGMNQVIFGPKKIKADLDFYGKMAKCTIRFTSK